MGMDAAAKAWTVGEDAMGAVAPESGLFAQLDPVSFTDSLLAVARRAARNPQEAYGAFWRYGLAMARVGPEAVVHWMGRNSGGPSVQALAKDKRFADPSWRDNPVFYAIAQAYFAGTQLTDDLLAAGRGEPLTDAKAQLMAGLIVAALAPTNYLATNPAALKRAFETGGASLLAGFRNFLDDLRNNNGMPRQVDTRPFEIGTNLAATPGKVVFRNDLMELIQYAPQTPQVRSVPVLASPPWINKYYIMDLAPGRSFLEWAITHERTVFAISYRNPGPSMSGVTLDDYLVHGPQTALEVIGDITGAPKIDIIGLCLGGALTGMLAAYLTAIGDQRLGSITLLNTLLDYSEPGVLGAFTDEVTVSRLEKQMEEKGVLEGRHMATTFDALRPNDLIFNYVVSNWLLGQDPPAFDILAWNSDNTRMPAAMHAFYLRSLYLRNELARGVMEIKGQQLSLAGVTSDAYVVGAINDHIVPWPASYKATGLLGGDVRYVLSSGGHIAGIVNPPGPKAWYEVAKPPNPVTAQQWREAAERNAGSWWEDWARWAGRRAGRRVDPPPMGSEKYPAIADAPGTYIHG
jgi:poly[(R)-3-hydroxyalkanoate] polymerase subunit PhaC